MRFIDNNLDFPRTVHQVIRQHFKSVLFCLIGMALVNYPVTSVAETQYTLDLRLAQGGDSLGPTPSSTINSGDGALLAIGLEYYSVDTSTIVSLSLGYGGDSTTGSSCFLYTCYQLPTDEKANFDYLFLDLGLQFVIGRKNNKLHKYHLLGAGITYISNAEYTYENISGFGNGKISLEDSQGYFFEYMYRGRYSGKAKNVGIGLRHTEIEFDLSGQKIDASNYSLIMRWSF